MKKYLFFMVVLILGLGCARVRMEAPKDPIKVDVSMRLDIYQHIEKDIDEIEDIVAGSKEDQSFLGFFVESAYAQDLSPEVEEAALRRKDRRSELVALEVKGIVGENQSGLVVVRISDQADQAVQDLIQAENNDRITIYQAVAKKNGSPIEDVKKLYAKRLQEDAPSGTPIEDSSGWRIK
ncbi:MAG: YdbL family protein [Candidatus Omnitrophica bacterium]|nr:YdbL family protein [Candidatus Omnitrophota bacterium]